MFCLRNRRRAFACLVLLISAFLIFLYFLQESSVYNLHSLETPSEGQQKQPSPHAFVFYATNSGYVCAAILMIHQLSILSPGIPTILMVPTDFTGKYALKRFEPYNTTILYLTPPPLWPGHAMYYRQVLLKLMAFSLHEHLPHLKRVVVLDADQTVRKPLHHLFELSPTVEFAAPEGYWLNGPGITSTLLVISLGNELWREVKNAMKHIPKGQYDMDLLNRLFFPKRTLMLSGAYCTLNSHWEQKRLPEWMANKTAGLTGLWEDEASLVHFTAGGKPWDINMRTLEKKKDDGLVDEQFFEMYVDWRKEAVKRCAPGWNMFI